MVDMENGGEGGYVRCEDVSGDGDGDVPFRETYAIGGKFLMAKMNMEV